LKLNEPDPSLALLGALTAARAGAAPPAPSEVFQGGDPRLSDPLDPNLPNNRVVMWGAPSES
jgi:hypothetical protein